jgi:hypothetical protein
MKIYLIDDSNKQTMIVVKVLINVFYVQFKKTLKAQKPIAKAT